MLGVFTDMGRVLLQHLGQDALLRGSVVCRVNIEHGIEVIGQDDRDYDATRASVQRDVATISSEYDPRQGDTLQHPDGVYRLVERLSDNGINQRWIVMPV